MPPLSPTTPTEKPDDVHIQTHTQILSTVQPHGGRQMAMGSDFITWLGWIAEEAGGTWAVMCSRIPAGYEAPEVTGGKFYAKFAETVVSGLVDQPMALCVAVDDLDQPAVVYSTVTAGTYTIQPYLRESEVWNAKTTFPAAQMVEWISLEVNALGEYYVLYPQRTAGLLFRYLYRVSTDDMATWSILNVVSVGSTAWPGSDTHYIGQQGRGALAVDSAGDVHMVFCEQEATTEDWVVKYRKLVVGVGFDAVEDIERITVAQQTGGRLLQRMVSLAIDANDVPHVVWVGNNTNDHQENLGAFYSSRVGGAWSAPAPIVAEYPHDFEWPALSLELNGNDDLVCHVLISGQANAQAATDKRLYWIARETMAWGVPIIIGRPPAGSDATGGQIVHSIHASGRGTASSGFMGSWSAGTSAGMVWNVNTTWRGAAAATSPIGIVQSATPSATTVTAFATSTFLATSVSTAIKHPRMSVQTNLTLSQAAGQTPHGRTVIAIGQTADPSGSVLLVSAVTALSIDSLTWRLSPNVCETNFVPSPPIQGSYDARLTTRLSGPYVGPTLSVQLPRPMWSDARVLDTRVVTQRNRAGQPLQFVKDNTVYTLSLSWRGLSRRKLLELDAFFAAMAGRTIRYTDHEDNAWRVHVAQSPIPITYGEAKDFDNRLELVLEGVQVS